MYGINTGDLIIPSNRDNEFRGSEKTDDSRYRVDKLLMKCMPRKWVKCSRSSHSEGRRQKCPGNETKT